MKHLPVILVAIVFIIAALLAGLYAGKKVASFQLLNKTANVNVNATLKEILPAAEYASLVYHYTTVITHSDALQIFSKALPLTEKKTIYMIDGAIRLGFNSEDVKTDVSEKNIILYMPEIKMLSHEIYPETFKSYDEKTSFFNKYNLTDAYALQKINKDAMEEKVKQNGAVFIQARKLAEQQISSLIKNSPAIKDKYEIVFEWAKQ
ncbi:MAG: DUF4230 domain-containing protein [Endomicrobia bacterium]|nr:DUF4230 domain-containing protein [Endomicrobiia bacterium]MCL2506642.1 DUF4230 domain-containing protein [Endomicrobiia bacterium]